MLLLLLLLQSRSLLSAHLSFVFFVNMMLIDRSVCGTTLLFHKS